MNRYIVSAIALMASAGIALAQSPKAPDAGPPAARQEASPPAAKSEAPGQMKSGEGAAKSIAPGQAKPDGGSARSVAPEQEKEKDAAAKDDGPRRAESNREDDASKGKSRAKNAQSQDEPTNGPRAKGRRSTGGLAKDGSEKSAVTKEQAKGGKAAEVHLKPEQETKVVTTFRRHHVAPAKNINISVSVGTIVPKRVKLYAIPQDILVIAPVYRRYKYFVVEDRIIIVEPVTYEIVDVLVLA